MSGPTFVDLATHTRQSFHRHRLLNSHQERGERHQREAQNERSLPAVPIPDPAYDETAHGTHDERASVYREARDES